MLVVEPMQVEDDMLLPCAHLFELIHFARDESVTAVAHRITYELQMPDLVSPLAISGLLFELLAMAVRRQRPLFAEKPAAPLWLKTVHDYLHTYFNQSFQLIDLANEVGIHPVHLSRVFRIYYGLSLGDYVRRLRLEWVTHQLTTSDKSLTQLAHAAGFSDQSHFTRVFKRYMGVTPGRYRQGMKR